MDSLDHVANGVRIHTLFRSGRPTILFLHGLAGHGGEWKQVGELLNVEVGVIAPDQRGHGRSWDGSEVEVSRSAYVSDAVSLIEQLAERPIIVVGQSMGGLVATFLAASRPDLVDQLVLIEAGIHPMAQTDLAALGVWFDRWPPRFADEDEAAEFFGTDKPSTMAWVDGLVRTSKGLERRFDPGTMLRAMRALGGTDRAAAWKQISSPTTLIRASDGHLGQDEIDEMVAARPDTRVVQIEDSGHDVHLDQPDAVAAALTDIAARTG